MTWTHRICERCWFLREPERWPVQIKREAGDLTADHCCFCGTLKITRIYVRQDPKTMTCSNMHDEEDE